MDIERRLVSALTVGELIERLKRYPKDAYVVFSDDYGDRTHTEQALPVRNVDSLGNNIGGYLYETAYSNSGLAIRRDDSDYYNDEQAIGCPAVVVLS